jgi:hypothetical protein
MSLNCNLLGEELPTPRHSQLDWESIITLLVRESLLAHSLLQESFPALTWDRNPTFLVSRKDSRHSLHM